MPVCQDIFLTLHIKKSVTVQFCNVMKNIWVFLVLIAGMFSCTRSQSHYNDIIDSAELVMSDNPDSALSMLDFIDPSELKVDSIKAKYYYVIASLHDSKGDLMLSDSLINFSVDFYRGKDLRRSIHSTTLLALYKYWIGESKSALAMMDSLSNLENVPDSLLVIPLREKAFLGEDFLDANSSETTIRRLLEIEKESGWRNQYKYWLYIDYLFNGKNDSALVVLDGLLDVFIKYGSDEDSVRVERAKLGFEYEKIGVLEELGRYAESMSLADKLLVGVSDETLPSYLHLWKALCWFNMGHRDESIRELEIADSCATGNSDNERGYYNSFAFMLKTALDYQKTGKLSLIRMAKVINTQRNVLLRSQAMQRNAKQSALEIENKRLALKVKSERQNAIIIIVVFATIIISCLLLLYARSRKRKELEAIEQAEVLQKLVDELNAADTSIAQNEALRRAMLQQLGIIKMVAETPTEQNREMLRKISSIDSKVNGSLVNWENVYDIIDNLYGGFYSGLHKRHGDVLTEKEEQIIVLMLAGFSTKEISVITSQTTATVYVRKSSIRKKLGVAEKEDIVAFLRHEASV